MRSWGCVACEATISVPSNLARGMFEAQARGWFIPPSPPMGPVEVRCPTCRPDVWSNGTDAKEAFSIKGHPFVPRDCPYPGPKLPEHPDRIAGKVSITEHFAATLMQDGFLGRNNAEKVIEHMRDLERRLTLSANAWNSLRDKFKELEERIGR